MIDISIIVPIYNTGKKLNKCINSILNQSYKNFELILINDGSTDNSLEICERYKIKDSRIILINQNNSGAVLARKSGINIARGKYFVFIDSDDWIDKNFLKRLYEESEKGLYDIVACNSFSVYGNGLIKREEKYFYKDNIYNNNDVKNKILSKFAGDKSDEIFPTCVWAKMYDRKLFQEYGEYYLKMKFFGEDLALNIEMIAKAEKIKVIEDILYYHRCGGGTSKYMSELFYDISTTYDIQKDCINNYFFLEREDRISKVAFIFLNTYKMVLVNLFAGNIEKNKALYEIEKHLNSRIVQDAIYNLKEKRNWFDIDYIEALEMQNIEYLYNWGKQSYKKIKFKKFVKNLLIKLNI